MAVTSFGGVAIAIPLRPSLGDNRGVEDQAAAHAPCPRCGSAADVHSFGDIAAAYERRYAEARAAAERDAARRQAPAQSRSAFDSGVAGEGSGGGSAEEAALYLGPR
jgi:hypothetical protein